MTNRTLAVLFVACTMAANIMSLRMVEVFGFVTDAGAILYPATFIIRDLLHKNTGLRESNHVVTLSAVCNAAMFAMFALTAWLPYDAAAGPQSEFGMVLLPGFLIVAGSVVGQFVGERFDGRIYHSVQGKHGHLKASLASNVVSIPVDTILMCGIAFGFTMPLQTLVSAIATNVLIKYAVMAVFAVFLAADSKRQVRR